MIPIPVGFFGGVGAANTSTSPGVGSIAISGRAPNSLVVSPTFASPGLGAITAAGLAPTATVATSDPDFASVALLCHMNGSNNTAAVTDSTAFNRTITATTGGSNNVTISTTESKFGGASLRLAGAGGSSGGANYSGTPASLSFGTGDFTLECWLYLASTTASFPAIFQISGAAAGRFYFAKYPDANQLYVQAPGQTDIGPVSAGFSAATWTHVAWTRASGVSKFWVAGSQVHSVADSNNYQAGIVGFVIGPQLGSLESDYIDDLRITTGVARYTAGFTPPTAQFPDS